MKKKEIDQKSTVTIIRIAYLLFILLSLYHILYNENYIDAATNLGIALVFDPFDQNKVWNNRPRWQRIWLLVHLILAVGLLVYGFYLSK